MIVLKWNFANSELCYKLILFELILYLIYNIIYNIKSMNIIFDMVEMYTNGEYNIFQRIRR